MRERIFAPHKRGLGYIHIQGFVFEHCANQFPNAFWDLKGWPQAGAVSCRSGNHWLIENNVIRFAKSIGLDCGSEGGRDLEGDQPIPDGVGYHIIRNNVVSDNGCCGITGWKHTSTKVIGNIVERNNRLGFLGAEEAGIKFHYFIDGMIEGNLVRDNDGHGIWLDNVWTGSRVTKNACINNFNSGIFMELGQGPCLVDHNILAFSRSGDGIYMHDASAVTVAHNLFFCNSHFGLFNRIVTDRPFEKAPGELEMGGCSQHQILNNVFIDNYRGHLSVPLPSNRVKENLSDYNLFLNGSQWNWEGLGYHSFHLNRGNGENLSEGDLAQKFKELLKENNVPTVNWPNLSLWKDSPYLTREWWTLWTNNDVHSLFLSTESGELVNGFVEKGSILFSPQEMYIYFRNSNLITQMACPPIEGLETDFYGKLRTGDTVCPGPFQTFNEGYTKFVFWQHLCNKFRQ